jgi:hypothetical protein
VPDFANVDELFKYRKICPICRKPLYCNGFSAVNDNLILKESYRSDDYIFNIKTRTNHISASCVNIASETYHSGAVVNSINPLELSLACSTTSNQFLAPSECGIVFNIHYNKYLINKISIIKEVFYIKSGNLFKITIDHKAKRTTIDELSSMNKNIKTFNLKYGIFDPDKYYREDYILNKINSILILQ